MFIDTAKIFVKSGNGGNGAVSFRTEKYIPLGGPDGGDGGDGGDVILVVDASMTTLLDFSYARKFVAKNGVQGSGSKCYGKAGEKLFIKFNGYCKERKQTVMCDLSHDFKLMQLKGGGRCLHTSSNC
jgi:GTP-binding protein